METAILNLGTLSLLINGGGGIMPQNQFVQPIKPTTSIVQQVEKKSEEPKKPESIKYTVVEGDNLTKIAEANGTTWQKLWDKNTELKHQDQLNIGQIIVIPAPDEVLADRPPIPSVQIKNGSQSLYVPQNKGSTAGNGYDYGYCTWYVKNRRPDLPNNLGNANTWYYMAQANGMAVGSTPRVGAVGTTTAGSLGHVVYVEAVNGDGTITISEMNSVGWGVQSSRVASASAFFYIY